MRCCEDLTLQARERDEGYGPKWNTGWLFQVWALRSCAEKGLLGKAGDGGLPLSW